MCSDPQTFVNKETGEMVTAGCRRCNACIAVRRSGWVARGIAEKTCWPYALAITLSYNDDTQENRDAAKFFAYADVRDFIKRTLSASTHRQKGARVKFLCAGEQGDENGRCHWHLIVYSDVDLLTLGVFHGMKDRKKQVLTDREDLITVHLGRKKRLDWTLWGRGFVVLQDANQATISYALSYCLKDQFSIEKSEGTLRESTAENFATGLFRMSKYPPIGHVWLMRKMESLADAGAVLPNLKLKVPGMSGYWYPGGVMRQTLLWALVAVNKRVLWATGANAPHWPSLLASCKENETDLEVLNGKEIEQDPVSFETEIGFRGAETSARQRVQETARNCGGELPCNRCLRSLTSSDWDNLGVKPYTGGDGWQYFASLPGFPSVADRRKASFGAINIYCQNKRGSAQKDAFPNSSQDHWLCPQD